MSEHIETSEPASECNADEEKDEDGPQEQVVMALGQGLVIFDTVKLISHWLRRLRFAEELKSMRRHFALVGGGRLE
jgi:hypothetical protein